MFKKRLFESYSQHVYYYISLLHLNDEQLITIHHVCECLGEGASDSVSQPQRPRPVTSSDTDSDVPGHNLFNCT